MFYKTTRLLGYPSHVTLKIEDKIAKDPKTVIDFLGDLRIHLTPGGAKEISHLLELKKVDTETYGQSTDRNYYL